MKLRDDLNTPEVREALERMSQYDNAMVSARLPGFMAPDLKALLRAIRAPEPMQPPIPWEYIDKQWRYVAMNNGGQWRAFRDRPTALKYTGIGEWRVYAEHADHVVCGLPCPSGADRPWTETLCTRPGVER